MDLRSLFARVAAACPDTDAIVEVATGRGLTFAELAGALDGFGRLLDEHGVPAGGRVGILGDASLDYLVADYGTMMNGRVRVPFDPALSVPELRAQIADADIAILFHDPAGRSLAEGLDGVRTAPLPHEWPVAEEPARPNGPGDLASLNYTGGTTGRPKAVMHTHASLATVLRNIRQARDDVPGEVFLNVRPLWPIAAVSVFAHLCAGGTVALGGRFDPATFMTLLEGTGAAVSSLVPTQLTRLVQHHAARGDAPPALPRFRSLDIGAAALSADLLAGASRLLGPRIGILYGMTEAPWSVYLPAVDLGRLATAGDAIGAVGRPLAEVRIRLAAPAEGVEADEIEIAGPHLMVGYWRQPCLTASVLRDGWLATGDLGRVDADRMLRIVGRRKEIIRTGGVSVQPAEVADCLLAHPGVRDAHVFGSPDAQWGERIRAAVVLEDGCADSPEMLVEHCRARLSRYKVPKQVQIVPSLPRSHYGKVQLASLLRMLDG
jgi:acyl-CoA synthetase (AMP-forming)/AMP-acid ligase II